MSRKLDVELNKLLQAAVASAAAVSLIAIAPAEAQTKRVFGVGEPATISELPKGEFRSALEVLPPQAQNRALGLLRQGNVPIEDFVHLRVDKRGDLLFVDPDFENDLAEGEEETPIAPSEITEASAFTLHSKPGATNVLYLDFDGHDVQNSIWNSNSGKAVHPMRPYSRDSDYYNFSQTEIDIIADSWRQVTEDLAPFDIDVTTEEPPSFGSNVGHVLITQKQDAEGDFIYNCSCGGVAYINVWGNPYGFPGLVFNTSLRGVAEAASHEFGHNLGLYHDGVTGGAAYYDGHGSGDVSWGPIMGVGYYTSVTQWSKGEYPSANNSEDDLLEIFLSLGYQTDDHEDVLYAAATPLVIASGTDVSSLGRVSDPSWASFENKGIIEDHNDIDLFSMNVGAGTIDLTVTPAHHEVYSGGNRGSNLDIEITLLDEFGIVLQTSNPDLDIDANVNYVAAAAGVYYLKVTGVGRGDPLVDGYTDYGSIGQYNIHGTLPLPVIANDPPTAPTDLAAALVGDVNIDLTWTDPTPAVPEDNEVGYRVLRSSNGGASFGNVATLPANSEHYSDNNLGNGSYIYKLELFNSAGTTPSNITDPIEVAAPTVAVATSESTGLGSIASGSYLDTQTVAGSETLQEQHSGGKPNNRQSYLDHSWYVTGVVPGASIELYLSASAPANGELDDFVFTYSVDGGPPNLIGTVVNGTAQAFTVALDPTTGGTVEVNVVDSDPDTRGARNTDSVTIHEISITSAGDPGEQAPVVEIVAPADGTAVPGGTELVLEATADDFEDGDVSAGISWSSDVDGYLGTGPNQPATLSGGTPAVTHLVTASVTDSASNTSMTSILVHVDDSPTPTSMSVADLDGASVSARGGKWQADVTIAVLDDLGDPVAGAAVSGAWSNGANGSGGCTTNGSGVCTVSKGGLKNNVPSVTFSVTGIGGSLTYHQYGNTDPDTDSDGTTIVVLKP
jgi:hypothetical protein